MLKTKGGSTVFAWRKEIANILWAYLKLNVREILKLERSYSQ